MMRIGVDLDNTIVCYDAVFHALAAESRLIPDNLPARKECVRDYMRDQGAEDLWTELQGRVYGVCIQQAHPFPDVLEFFAACRRQDIDVWIISHRTRRPVRGPSVDLHAAARDWLQRHRFHDTGHGGLSLERVYFEETQERKLERITEIGCSHFIDDLAEFLARSDFPGAVQRILFDPHGVQRTDAYFRRLGSWSEIRAAIVPDHRTTNQPQC